MKITSSKRWKIPKQYRKILKREMHENFSVSEEIEDIEDYITYMTNLKLIELKETFPSVNIDGITVRFSRKHTRKLAIFRRHSGEREFIYNIGWIENNMDNPDFKKELDLTICHEVAHVIFPDHSPNWKIACRSIGGSGETKYKFKSNFKPPSGFKYMAECPICGTVYLHTKMPTGTGACGICYKKYRNDAILEFKPIL